MNEILQRVSADALGSSVTDEVYDALIGVSLADVVTADVKSQNGQTSNVSEAERQLLESDPKAWKGEIVRLKESVEMRLTSARRKLQSLEDSVVTLTESVTYADENMDEEEYQELKEKLVVAQTERSAERTRRVNSIRFLHALEQRLIDVNSLIRELSGS